MKKKILILLCTIGIISSFVGCGSAGVQSQGTLGENLAEDEINKLAVFNKTPDDISYNFDNLVCKAGSKSYDLMKTKSVDILQLGVEMEATSHSFQFDETEQNYKEDEMVYTFKDNTVLIVQDNFYEKQEDFRLLSFVSFDLSETTDKESKNGLFGLTYNSTLEEINETLGEDTFYYMEGDTTSINYDISINEIPMEVKVVYNHEENHLDYIEVSTYFENNFRFLSDEIKTAVKDDCKR